jgi:uncharacterized protein (TIGR03545 family)
MRKRFIYYVLIPALVLGVVLFLFLDTWVTLGLEAAGEKMVGAKVDIEGLHVSLMPVGLRWERLQVADPKDPWRNIFETRRVAFSLNVGQLLRSKYIIETMEINELILGTKRATDGSLPRAPEPPASSPGSAPTFAAQAAGALEKTADKTPVGAGIDLAKGGFNADSLVKVLDIRTLRTLDSVRQQAAGVAKQWQAASAEFETSKKSLADIEARVAAINPSGLNSLESITSAVSTVDNAIKGVNEVKNTFTARKGAIDKDVAGLSSSLALIEKTSAEDFTRLKKMASLPNLNSSGIAGMLVGQEMVNRATTYLHYVDLAREHIKNYQGAEPKEPAPARMKGQDIRFPTDRSYPKFWVKKALISGGTDTSAAEYIRAKGEIKNISDDQRVTGVPMTASLTGVEGRGKTFSLAALFDRTKATPLDEYEATLGGVPLAEFRIGSGGFLNGTLSDARMNSSVKVTVPGSAFDANSRIVLSGFGLHFPAQPKNLFEQIVRETLQGINEFTVGLRLWNTSGGFDVALSTDLDSKISEKAQGILGAQFAKTQTELKAKLDAVIGAKRAEVEKLVGAQQQEIQKQLGAYQGLVDQKSAVVDGKKKELTDRLEKEKQGKAKDLLKGIFKK